MSASFPTSIYSPRTKKNRAGVTYEPTKQDLLFVEDIQKLDDEVVAIENLLGINGQANSINQKVAMSKLLDSFFGVSGSKIVYNPLLSYDWASSAVGGSAIIGQFPMIGYVRTGSTANSYSRQNYNSQEISIGQSSAVNYTKINVSTLSGNKLGFVGIARTLFTTQTSLIATPLTEIHAGFIYEDGTWYCSTGNGTNQQTTAISALTGTHLLKIDGSTSGSIKFYVDGVLVATHSTYYSISYGYFEWFVANKAEASDARIYFYNHGYYGL